MYPTQGTGLSWIQLEDPKVRSIAAAHSVTPAQVLIQWQFQMGFPVNVRSQNVTHMRENLAAYDLTLTGDELKTLSNGPQAPSPRVRPVRPAPRPRYAWE